MITICGSCARRAVARLVLTSSSGGSSEVHCWRHAARAHGYLTTAGEGITYRWEWLPNPLLDVLARFGPFEPTMTDANMGRGLPSVFRFWRRN